MKLRTPLAGAILFALAACGSSPDETVTEAATDVVPANPAPIAAVQHFVDTVAASDLYESQVGQLAEDKGTSQAVKDFGAMMVKDHAASTAALKLAVTEAGPDIMLAPQLTSEQETKLDQLKAAAGSRFDDLYALQQVGAHEEALNLLKGYATTGGNAALREFAGKTSTVVEHHLAEARKLP